MSVPAGALYDPCADHTTTLAAVCGDRRVLKWRGSCGSERLYLAVPWGYGTLTIFYETATGKPVGWLHAPEYGEGTCLGDRSCPPPHAESECDP